MNEATLEGNLRVTLNRIFRGPLRPKIEHQMVMTLNFGHHEVLVDGKKASKAIGRLDVLLKADDRPLAVLELKRPELELTVDDETQAWSYARHIHPMPPFYIVTNGGVPRIFRTHDRSPVNGETIDEAAFAANLEAAAGAAAADEASAIKFLLGRSPDVFRRLFQEVTNAELALSTGSVEDFSQPIAKDFHIPRQASVILLKALQDKHSVIALVGPALSGKTNVAAGFCNFAFNGPDDARFVVPLYINCGQNPQGVFQTLAAGLAKQTKVAATADDVRHWLTSGLITTDTDRPVVILDGWPTREAGKWEAELSELLNLAGEKSFSLVVVLDDRQADFMLRDPDRGQKTRLGTAATVVRVSPYLSHKEFHVAYHVLKDTTGLMQESGSEQSVFFRLPYTWRLLAGLPRAGEAGIVPAVLGVELIHTAKKLLNPRPEILDALRRYARSVAEENRNDAVEDVLIGSPGWVTWETAERVLGDRGFERLQGARLIRGRVGPRMRALVSMQVPPVLAFYAAEYIREQIEPQAGKISVEAVADQLLSICSRFPYAAVVGADVVLSWGTDEGLVNVLLSRAPSISRVSADMRLALPVEGQEWLDLPEDLVAESISDGCDHTFGDWLPYLILSYVARSLDLTTTDHHDVWKQIVDSVGSVGVPLVATEPISREWVGVMLPHISFSLTEGRTIIARESGIIEPIADAFRRAALDAPDMFRAWIEDLLRSPDAPLPLLNRVWTAMTTVVGMDTPHLEEVKGWVEALERVVEARLKKEIRPE